MRKRIGFMMGVLVMAAMFVGCGSSAERTTAVSIQTEEFAETEEQAEKTTEAEEAVETETEQFDEIIESLQPEQAYAYVDITGGEHQALLVAEFAYDNLDGNMAAISAQLYCVDADGKVIKYTDVSSDGTAYPFAVKDGYLYYGGPRHVAKVYIDPEITSIMCKEDASEEITDSDSSIYYYFSLDDEFEGEVEDDTQIRRLFDEWSDADVVNFTVVE